MPEKAPLFTQVVGSNGVPLTAARVWLEADAGEIEPLTDTSGEQFFVVEPGEYTLCVVCPSYKEVTRQVWLKAKDITSHHLRDSAVVVRLEKE